MLKTSKETNLKRILQYILRPAIALAAFYIFISLFTFILYNHFETTDTAALHRFLLFNIFLAAIPLVLSTFMIWGLIKKIPKAIIIIVVIVWLLFYPNTFYIISDLLHITRYNFYNEFGGYASNWVPWAGLLQFTMAALIGCGCGILSLYTLQKAIATLTNKWLGWGFSLVTLFLTSIAIFLGRVLRFNSWNVFTDPAEILRILKDSISSFSITFILLFTFCSVAIYCTAYFFLPKSFTSPKNEHKAEN